MCKVAGVTKITDKNRNDVWVFMQLLGQLISAGNNDGLGYAAFDKDNNLFGERWLINESAFKDLTKIPNMDSEKMARVYNHFGVVDKDSAQAIIMHTRAATCGRGILNTHPFVDNLEKPTVALIHNGMIYNEKKFPRNYSTCDSEVLAPLYATNKVGEDLEHLNKFTPELEGWFTVLALSLGKDGKPVMDAFSDSGRLGSYYIEELETRIYSTYADDVARVAQMVGLTAVDEMKVNADNAFRLDVATGEEIAHFKFKSYIPTARSHSGGFPSMWDGWGNVQTMHGNLDDEAFKHRWFGHMLPDDDGHYNGD